MSKHLTAGELIEALQKLDPNAEVLINIKQSNQVYGVVQLPIIDSRNEHQDYQEWVSKKFGGSITVFLPDGAYIAKLPKV